MKYKLLILVTRFNVVLEFHGPNGTISGHQFHFKYNYEFGWGYEGVGQIALLHAIMDILYLDDEVGLDARPYYEFFDSWTRNQRNWTESKVKYDPMWSNTVIEVDEGWLEDVPFLQEKDDRKMRDSSRNSDARISSDTKVLV